MADISKLEQQADLLMQNVSGWETSTLERIGKRIKKYGKLSLSDVKSINNIAVVKQDMDAITKELAKVTGYNISQIENMYGELLEEQHLANQPLYDYRGKKFVPFAENRELQAIARAYAKTTGETMINLAKTKALCVMGANGKPIGMQKYYTDVLDKAVMQVSTGATDFHTAMRDSIIELGGSGVRVDYGGGVTRRLDTVVRQNLLWGAKQASVEYNEMIGEELGCDGYEVDWHSNPRPSHEFMQGKQFVVGKARTINGIHFESADEALERLQDYGCLHYRTPIICGISEPRYSPEELKRLNEQNAKKYTIDGKEYSGYEVTQMQRRLESSVRNEKTTRDLAKASGDNALVKRCNERIKAYQGKYNEISEITGIQGDKKRMSVPRGTTIKGATPTPKKVDVLTPKQELEQLKQKAQNLNSDDNFVEWYSTNKRIKELESQIEVAEAKVPEPKNIFKKIESPKEVRQQLTDLGFDSVTDRVSVLNGELMVKNTNQLTELEQKFGAIKKGNISLDVNARKKAKAFVSVSSDSIEYQDFSLSGHWFKKTESEVISGLSQEIKDGFKMVVNPEKYSVYTVTHEYGHIIENNVINDAFSKLSPLKQRELSTDGTKWMLWRNEQADNVWKEITGIAKEITGDDNFLSYNHLSDYGKTNTKEAFAESFASFALGGDSVMGKAIGVWFERKGLIIK
jgi:hypothetical protein